MRARLLLAALALVLPAVPARAGGSGPVVVEFQGSVTLGCLNCDDPARLSGTAIVVEAGGAVWTAPLTASLWEDTTPDPCPVLLEAVGTFAVGSSLGGELHWLRSTNAIVLTTPDGGGAAVVAADPVHLALASCGSANETYPVVGSLVLG